jgi:hypothetical protein
VSEGSQPLRQASPSILRDRGAVLDEDRPIPTAGVVARKAGEHPNLSPEERDEARRNHQDWLKQTESQRGGDLNKSFRNR